MKIQKEISAIKIPDANHGGGRNKEYDDLADKIRKLPNGKAIPVECESLVKAQSVIVAMRNRDPDGFIRASRRGFTVYFTYDENPYEWGP